MKNKITDTVGVFVVGMLITVILAVTPWLGQQLELSSKFFSDQTVSYILYLLYLFLTPVVAAFYSAKRTRLNPFLAGITTCFIPAIAYFFLRYAMNVYIKVTLDDGSSFLNILGYVDPYDVAKTLSMAVMPCVWALGTGGAGGAMHFLTKRKTTSGAVCN